MVVLNQLLDLPGFHVDHLTVTGETTTLSASPTASTASCPDCGVPSSRIHSYYARTLRDLPWGPRRLQLTLALRRFRCREPACARQTFVERLPTIALPYARVTTRLRYQQQQLGLAAGGELGARLASRLRVPTSPDTLIRLIRAAPLPEIPPPKVIGLDDWAKRKGHTHGTLIIDLETHRPLDVLPERTPEVVAAWLRRYPTIEVITRDRADDYITGASAGASQARQIADRWHLLKNAGEALQRLVERQSAAVRATAKQVAEEQLATQPEQPATLPPTEIDFTAGIPPAPPSTHRQHRYEEVVRLLTLGWSARRISIHLGVDRRTVKKYRVAGQLPARSLAPQNTSLAALYLPDIEALWSVGYRSYQAIWTELQKLGFPGSYSSVRRLMKHFQPAHRHSSQNKPHQDGQPAVRMLSARRTMWLLIQRDDQLKPEEQHYRDVLLQQSPALVYGRELVQQFMRLVRERQPDQLDGWLTAAAASGLAELRSFAVRIRRDYSAVKAALQEEWSNGPVEAHVHRLKFIKRSMVRHVTHRRITPTGSLDQEGCLGAIGITLRRKTRGKTALQKRGDDEKAGIGVLQ